MDVTLHSPFLWGEWLGQLVPPTPVTPYYLSPMWLACDREWSCVSWGVSEDVQETGQGERTWLNPAPNLARSEQGAGTECGEIAGGGHVV